MQYEARDRQKKSQRGRRAFVAAEMIIRDRIALHTLVSDLKTGLIRSHFNAAVIEGKKTLDLCQLRFDSQWLENISRHLKENWCGLHRSFSNPSNACNKFDIMAWLATMAYATSTDMDAIQALAAMYRFPGFASIQIPVAYNFNLSRGNTYDRRDARAIVENEAKTYDSSAEAMLPRLRSETDQQHLDRIRSLFETRKDNALNEFLSALEFQWPVCKPVMPSSTSINEYFDLRAISPAVEEIFRAWWNNRLFLEYLDKFTAAMRLQVVVEVPTPSYIITLPTKDQALSDEIRQFGMHNIFSANLSPISQACK